MGTLRKLWEMILVVMGRLMDTKNLTSWLSLGIAIVAIVLSQLPPIASFFAVSQLTLTANRSLQAHHYLGDLILTPFLQINNSGNAQATISRIELIITKQDDSSFQKDLLAQTYYPTPEAIAPNESPTMIPFGRIPISPSEFWENYVTFFEPISAARRSQIEQIGQRVDEEIDLALANELPSNNEPVTISDDLFDEIKSLSDERLSFEIGEYTLHLKLYIEDDPETAAETCYSLTIFDGDVTRFDAITEEYRIGMWILFPGQNRWTFTGELDDVVCMT